VNVVKEEDEEIAQHIAIAEETSSDNINDNLPAVKQKVPLAIKIVKLKLNTFLRDSHRVTLHGILNKYVLRGNKIIGEAYALANFHILRLLQYNKYDIDACYPVNVVKKKRTTDFRHFTEEQAKHAIPVLDRNFFYACLIACSSCEVRETTIGKSLAHSTSLFDTQRGAHSTKSDFTGMTQMLSDLSIVMATMTTNHIQMNLETRISGYIKMLYGKTIIGYGAAIVRSLTTDLKKDLAAVFPTHRTNSKSARAMGVASHLRSLLPEDYNPNFVSHVHKTLLLYSELLYTAETEKEAVISGNKKEEEGANKTSKKRTRVPRTFNILPMKNSYTLGYIPFSKMTLLTILKRSKIENFTKDGRYLSNQQLRGIWKRAFHLNEVETRNNCFGSRILTDGYGVSVQLQGLSSDGNVGQNYTLQNALDDQTVPFDFGRKVAVDPGFSDVVTCTDNRGDTVSYSSSRYYEEAGYYTSSKKK
jgi:hypothetical protein